LVQVLYNKGNLAIFIGPKSHGLGGDGGSGVSCSRRVVVGSGVGSIVDAATVVVVVSVVDCRRRYRRSAGFWCSSSSRNSRRRSRRRRTSCGGSGSSFSGR